MTNSSSVVSTPTPAPCFGQCPKENNFFGGPFSRNPGFNTLNLPLEIGCRGVINQRNAVNLESICNQLGIRGLKKLKGALGRIALIGSYRIWLARNSQEWSAGELIKVKA